MTPCLTYSGTTDGRGYGWRRSPNFRTTKVHRQIMAMVYGEGAIKDLNVLHHCDNPPCFRFDHLYLGTQADNVRDMWSRGRGRTWAASVTHCPQGHEYTEENTRINVRGARVCIACARQTNRRFMAAKRRRS